MPVIRLNRLCNIRIYSGILAGAGWRSANLAWLAGGLWLLWQKAIRWHIPLSFLVTLALCATLGCVYHQKHWQHRKFICCLVRPCSAHSLF
ncbi:RnfABCDGE type electron transport complex subunit D [Escherichia coli]